MHNVRVQCNILACTLAANTRPGLYAMPENLRLVIVVPTVCERTTTDRTFTPASTDDIKELVHASVTTRLYHEAPPMRYLGGNHIFIYIRYIVQVHP